MTGSGSGGGRDRRQERVREREEQREAESDEPDRVQQAGDDEHLHLQRRGQLGLARRAFQELAAEQAEADGGTQGAHAEDDADGECGETLDLRVLSNVFHFFLRKKSTNWLNG